MKISILAVAMVMVHAGCKAKPLGTIVEWPVDSDLDSILDESEELGNPWEKSGEFEGDIILGPGDSIRNGLVRDEFYWPNKTLVYKIDSETFDEDQIAMIQRAVGEFHKKTCIRMRQKEKDDSDFVFITGKHAHGCSSHVGRQGGKQVLNLLPNDPGKGCFKKGTIIHELLHALGFYHQQSAPERDEYVKILWENIEPGREHNFKKYERDTVTNFDIQYDYHSIMHYSAYAFSKNDEKTIVPVEEGVRIGQRKTLSRKDIEKLHHMYHCKTDNLKPEKEGSYESPRSDEKDTDAIETIFEN